MAETREEVLAFIQEAIDFHLAGFKEDGEAIEDFPWFQEQTVRSIVNVEEHSPGHFYWPDLDVDVSQEIIEHPERFPLKATSLSNVGRPRK